MSPLPSTFLNSAALIGLAEIGDKSQLVCLALAARHRAGPVWLGALVAFAFLNLLAVSLGALAAEWVPQRWVAGLVGMLFLAFGWHAWRQSAQPELEPDGGGALRGRSVFIGTLVLILLAELGDKTQLAVAGLASTSSALSVWCGATLALALSTGLAVWAGRAVFARLPTKLLQRLGALAFLLFGLLALGSLAR